MRVLVADTSVIVDLERGELLPLAFQIEATFAVPDVLFERELRPHSGERLLELGLCIESLDGDGVALAQAYRRERRVLTVADSFALALAKRSGWILLSGDGALRELAKREEVECHGVLWLLDLLEAANPSPRQALRDGLQQIVSHKKCRLPKSEVEQRLRRYEAALEQDVVTQAR